MDAGESGVREPVEEEGALCFKCLYVCVWMGVRRRADARIPIHPFKHQSMTNPPAHPRTHPADACVHGWRARRGLLPLLPHHEAHCADGLGEAALLSWWGVSDRGGCVRVCKCM